MTRPQSLQMMLFGAVYCSSRTTTAFTSRHARKSLSRSTPPPCRRQRRWFSVASSSGDDLESLIQAATQPSVGQPPLGGDWAGLAATFHPGDGSLIPVPEYLVPDALLEWGQEPKCLEVLVSEDIRDEYGNDVIGEDDGGTMTRITTTILPDTGCGIDNLETLKAQDEVDLEARWISGIDSLEPDNEEGATKVVGLQYPIGDNNELRVETIFGLEDDGGQFRMRVAIDLVPSPPDTFGIASPMVLTLERRTNAVSSGGTISDGGGLDGKTVMMLLGERLSGSKTFVDDPPLSSNYERDSIKHVSFPGNVQIAYGWLTDNAWVLQVGCVGPNGMRRVVSRQFTVTKSGELDFELRSWVEDHPQEAPVSWQNK